MKKGIIYILFAVSILTLGSCAKTGDIDDLQDQLNELDGKLNQLEQDQQNNLLAEIAALQAQISSLIASNSGLTSDYEALLASLTSLEEEIAAGETVYYGNVLTDDDFAMVFSEGATVITGNVVAKSQANVDALASVKMIGGNLELRGGNTVSLPALENVAVNLIIEGVNDADATVSLPMLKTVGADTMISDNNGVVSIDMPELILINGDLEFDTNKMLASVSLAKLDLIVGSLEIYEMNPDTYENGNLVALDLSSTDVNGDVMSSYLGEGSELLLGVVDGDFRGEGNGFAKIEILNATFDGSITIQSNPTLANISFPNMTVVNGDINVLYNVGGGFIGAGTSALTSLSCFDNLTEVGGNIDISGNMFPELDAFNNVETVGGGSIRLNENGQEKTLVNVFNALEGTGSYSSLNIEIVEKTEWFTGFAILPKANNVALKIVRTQDANWNQGEVAKLEGFDLLTQAYMLDLDIADATEVSAFPLLANLTKYGEYLRITMPNDTNVTLCSMSTYLTAVKNGDFDNQWSADVKATFFDAWNWMELDRTVAVDLLLLGCN